MEQKLFQDVPENEREAMLEANCHEREIMPVQKHFTEQEINEKRSEYLSNSIAIRRAIEKLKLAKEVYASETKRPIDENNYLLQNIRMGYIEVEEDVYLMADWENRTMLYYDKRGEFLKSRKMLPHERQTKIN